MNTKKSRVGLGARTALLVAAGILAPAALLGLAGRTAVRELAAARLADQGELAAALARGLDGALRPILEELSLAGRSDATLPSGSGALARTPFVVGTIRLDANCASPGGAAPPGDSARSRALDESARSGRPTVLPLPDGPPGRVELLVPLHDDAGQPAGFAGAILDLSSPALASQLAVPRPGGHRVVELLDSEGRTVFPVGAAAAGAPVDPHGPLVARLHHEKQPASGTCRGCHAGRSGARLREDGLALAPLAALPWAVAIREPEESLASAVRTFERRALVLIPAILAVGLAFAWGVARSVRSPVARLTRETERIAEGDLSRPIPRLGSDEVGRLAASFESMRRALAASLEEIRRANDELEKRVEDRTRELERLYRELREKDELRARLLSRAIGAQEEERRRVARELHDEACQTVSALLLVVDAALGSAPPSTATEKLNEVRSLAGRALDELHRLIFDLRPSVLDDLGLEDALGWWARRHLEPAGIEFGAEIEGLERRLPPAIEVAVFRIVQEAMANVVRHARAESVFVEIERGERGVRLSVEDDGQGFDPAAFARPDESGKGLGLAGMRERVELMGGVLRIDSAPGRGTVVSVEIPLPPSISGEES